MIAESKANQIAQPKNFYKPVEAFVKVGAGAGRSLSRAGGSWARAGAFNVEAAGKPGAGAFDVAAAGKLGLGHSRWQRQVGRQWA